MFSKFWMYLITASTLIFTNEAYKILVIFPFPAISHSILGNGYVEHLLNAGHQVTYITPFPRKDPPPNLNQIGINYEEGVLPKHFLNIEKILNKETGPTDIKIIMSLCHKVSEHMLRSKPVQEFIEDTKQTFDLVIAEWMFTEIYTGFAALFQCPFVWSSSVDPHWMILKLIDEIPNPAIISDITSANLPPLTFVQRVQGLWTQIRTEITRFWSFRPVYDSLYEEIFVFAAKKKGIAIPSFEESMYNASFVISNSHVSLGEPVRLPQNMKPVGGYHIDSKVKPLPEDLQKIMDNASNGVIYFSMGSNLQSKDMPNKMKREFLETFGQLKQTVLWKFEETLPDLPENVHILKWAPQQSILGHPNCVLFITHGGLLSTTEAVHFGVPMIGIPVFADQFVNVGRSVRKGFAKKVDLTYDAPKELKLALDEMLNNPSYRESVKYLSLIYHDRPVPPGKELVHWVEHAIKTRGAQHLRSRALQLSWYQKMYLDLATIVIVTLLGLYITIRQVLLKTKKQISIQKKIK